MYNITIPNKNSFINSCTWQHQGGKPVPYTNNSTARLIQNWNNSQVSYRNQMSNLPMQQNFRSESYSERNSSKMVIITIKTILNEKVGYQFFQETVAQPK